MVRAGREAFTVPAGVTSIHGVAIGAAGGGGYAPGGTEARVEANISTSGVGSVGGAAAALPGADGLTVRPVPNPRRGWAQNSEHLRIPLT